MRGDKFRSRSSHWWSVSMRMEATKRCVEKAQTAGAQAGSGRGKDIQWISLCTGKYWV